MKRRQFIAATSAAAAGTLAAPRLARSQAAKTLKFVPQANLSSLDAVAGTQYVVRNAALMIWETLYGIDSNTIPHPQMAESHENSPDYKVWTFKLRPGLKFHDNEPVLSKDVVASLARWMSRDTMGQRIKATLEELVAVDDRTVRIKLSKPFPKMLFALGKSNAPVALIMPERIAKTDPFQLITEYVGLRPDVVREGRVGAGQQGRVQEVRGLRAPSGEGRLAVGRQADELRPDRVADPAGRCDEARPRCRTARSTGGRTRSPTWCRC